MAIVYPLAMPTNKGIAQVHIGFESVVGVSESPLTFSQQTQVFPGQRWTVDVTLPPMKRIDAAPWIAFLQALNGREGTFLCSEPTQLTPLGSWAGSPVVVFGSAGNKALAIGGLSNSVNGIIKAGDLFHMVVGSNYRLHRVLQDANSNGSGQATIYVWPNLREAPTPGTALVSTNAKGQFKLTSPINGYDVGAASNYSLAFAGSEAL